MYACYLPRDVITVLFYRPYICGVCGKSTSTTTAFRLTSELTQVRPALELMNLDGLVVISVELRVMN